MNFPNPDQIRAELAVDAFLPLSVSGESTTFDASSSTGAIERYEWQFCDGTRLTGTVVEKTFTENQTGTCSVMLTVYDSSGKGDAVVGDVEVIKPLTYLISDSAYSRLE
jgi:PKD repeat protein